MSKLQEALRSLGAKRLLELTTVVKLTDLAEGETLFEEGDPPLVRIQSVRIPRLCLLLPQSSVHITGE